MGKLKLQSSPGSGGDPDDAEEKLGDRLTIAGDESGGRFVLRSLVIRSRRTLSSSGMGHICSVVAQAKPQHFVVTNEVTG